jgi:thioredoxin reductase
MGLRTKHCFFLGDGRTICNVTELIGALKDMDDVEYRRFSSGKNDFVSWLRDALGLPDLAKKIKGLEKEQVIAALETGFVFETIIVGAGFAGITSSIYAARKRMNYMTISKDVGGQIAVSGDIQNYPGFAKTNFLEFQKNLNVQLKFNHVHINEGVEVKSITKKGDVFSLQTNKGVYKSYTVILTLGARARKIGVPGEEKFGKKGVTYCAICDGPLFKNKKVAIVGGGNSALEAVDFMMHVADKIYMVVLDKKLKGHQTLIDKVRGKDKVEILYGAMTKKIIGETMVSGMVYEQDGKTKQLDVEGVIVEIGRIPNTEMVKGLVRLDAHGHIVVNKHAETSVPGCFAGGDVSDVHEYQYIIAGGMGCMCLLRAANYLARLDVSLKAHVSESPQKKKVITRKVKKEIKVSTPSKKKKVLSKKKVKKRVVKKRKSKKGINVIKNAAKKQFKRLFSML